MKASIIVVGVAAAVLAGCGGIGGTAGASSSAASASPSPGRGAFGNGVTGQVVQLAAGRMTVSDQSGDVKVTYDSSTSVLQSGTGSLSEAVVGTCVVATGTTDASGAVTARTFQVQLNMNGNCTPPAGAGGPGGFGGAGQSPRPGRSPGPGQSPGGGPPANFAQVRGKVTSVSGGTFAVQPQTGAAVTVTVPSGVQVSRLVTSSSARLAVGTCVTANGTRDSSGTVKARTILISPPGPNGCSRGGFGGGGGRGRPSASPGTQSA